MATGRPGLQLPGALDAVLALDRPGLLDSAYVRHEFSPGDRLDIGPFQAHTRSLPHSVPNAGVRLVADGRVLAYTGDTGPSPPGTDPAAVHAAAEREFDGRIGIATSGLVVDLA
ncbi:MAG: hypothetical protein V7603_2109 [Micromonosporaceae bacterium]